MSQFPFNNSVPHTQHLCWIHNSQESLVCSHCSQAYTQSAHQGSHLNGPPVQNTNFTEPEDSASASTTGSTNTSQNSSGKSTGSSRVTRQGQWRNYTRCGIPPVEGLGSPGHYTPTTVIESYACTPAPMKTPANTSLSHQLSYINQRLLDHLANPPKSRSRAPHFPPGLEAYAKEPSASLSQALTIAQLENQIISYPSSQKLSGFRRSRSRALREESESTPPDVDEAQSQGADTKRRKLCRDESSSAHTFMTTEPASLRKAKSLLAQNTDSTSDYLTTANVQRFEIPAILVPAIPSQEVAATRLRMLFSREAKQRTEDTRLTMDAERPDSLMIDDDLRVSTIEWLFSVKGPAGDSCKPLRHHLRASLETRFHAVRLFSRYATRLPDARFNPFLIPRKGQEDPYQTRIREKLVGEIALACLAIAAKFHHDFLPPLKSVNAVQFLCIFGDRYPVAFDDLELAQKKVLKSFNYIIYQPTPQAYLEEVWQASHNLQAICDGDLKPYRTQVQARTLELIETCLHEQESMSWPVFHLATAALLEAMHIEELHQQCMMHSLGGSWECEPCEQTVAASPRGVCACVACVSNEICDMLAIPQNSLLSCRDWIMTIWVGEMTDS